MSYLLEQLPDGRYRLEIDGSAVCFSSSVFQKISSKIQKHESVKLESTRAIADEEARKRMQESGVGDVLQWNSAFKYSIERGVVASEVISAISHGFLIPNGSLYWSGYFSKIDWANDGHLFEPLLKKSYGDDALSNFLEYNESNATLSIFGYLTNKAIEDINKLVGNGTHLVNIGLTDSRDYTAFSYACAKVYGYDSQEPAEIVDREFAKEHLFTLVDALHDAAVFIHEAPCRVQSSCPGLEHWASKKVIEATARSIPYLSNYFTDRDWQEICRSEIWLLVKDIISVRKSRGVAA